MSKAPVASALVRCSEVEKTLVPTILVLGTGGTIAQSKTSTEMLSVEDLLSTIPGTGTVFNVLAEQIFEVISPDITPNHWVLLGNRINEILSSESIDGLVLTHGTDTLEETAFYLNLVVKSTKPVVVVGSMRTSDSLNADGPINLQNALYVAASTHSVGKGVLVTLNDQIESARDVSKIHTSSVGAFQSPVFGSLGYVRNGKVEFYRSPVRLHTVKSEFSSVPVKSLPKVDVCFAYAGVGKESLDAYLQAGSRGVIIAGTGDGSIPASILPTVKQLCDAGVLVVRSSRTNAGNVMRNGEADDDLHGLIVADSLNPQKARVLLMLALTISNDVSWIQSVFDRY